MPILNRKEKLDLIFNRIILKIYNSTDNLTERIFPTDFLRNEIKIILYVSMAVELRVILIGLVHSCPKEIDLSLLMDIIINFSLLSSKQRCIHTLHMKGKNSLALLHPWLISAFKKDEFGTSMILLKWIIAEKENNSTPLITSLIENFIIRLTNIMVFELFSNEKFSRGILLHYTTDYFSFYYNLSNLKFSLYWKFYLGNFYYLLKTFYRRSYLISICTKKGIVLKQFYSDSLTSTRIIPEKDTLFLDFLNILENILMQS
jgi:hypothetical protein